MSKIRQQRTAEQLRVVLSELFLRELSDPRLHGITITKLDIDRELEHADIYVSALGDESRKPDVMAALGSAEGFLRRELASRIRLRKVPQLHFHWDPSLAHIQEVESILDNLDIPPADDEQSE
ncbi:MAG: 30S ribosome-binding factor RbfA [Ardenticatenaceae bacterium]|nr:30S ribosome-binding factor RbfA [Ardenticatenaceae bacterium]MCB8950011.1 30S ribosome-binding factor RbfA [Ardenticatenaceae bacterium]